MPLAYYWNASSETVCWMRYLPPNNQKYIPYAVGEGQVFVVAN